MTTNRTILAIMLVIALFAAIVPLASAASIPLRIDKVKIDGIELQENASNMLDIQRGQEVEVEVTFTALSASKNVQMEAFMSGFEYSDIAPLSASTMVFDAEENVTYVRRVRLRISDEVQEDAYKLRVIVSDRNSDAMTKNYNLKIDVPRNGLKVSDVTFFPDGSVEAGKGLLATVRVENKGERDQNDVRVQISIPELGVSGVDYIDEIKSDREKGTEEIFVKIPENARSGRYQVRIDIDFNQLHDHITAVRDINVVGGSSSGSSSGTGSNSGSSGSASKPAEPSTVITVNSQLEAVTPGKGGALFPITIVNNDEGAKAYSLAVTGGDWADVKVSPSSTMILERGDAKLFSVYVTPHGDVKAGTQSLTIIVSSNGKTLKELQLTANVLVAQDDSLIKPDVVRVLEVVFILLLVILVVVGLVIAFKRRETSERNDDSSDMRTYY